MQTIVKYRLLLVLTCFCFALLSCKEEGPILSGHTPQIEPAEEVSFNISEKTISFDTPDSTICIVHITAQNVEWVITGVPDWITVVPMSGNGDADVTICCSENRDIYQRQGVFVLSGRFKDQQLNDITLGVVQPRCANRYATVDNYEYVFNGIPIDTILIVDTNTDDFQVEISDNLKEWCSVTADTKDHTIHLKTSYLNKDKVAKEGYFYIVTSDERHSVKVIQRPLDVVSFGSTIEFSVKGGRKAVPTSGNCLEINTSNNWIESEVYSIGNQTELIISTTKNYSVSERNGFVYVVLSDGLFMEIPIHQEGIVFNVNNHAISVKAKENDTVLYISSNVPWRIDDIEAEWVTVDPVYSDSACSVNVKINKNNTLYERSTNLSVYPELLKDLRQTINVTQDGISFSVDTTTLVLSCEGDTIDFFVNTDGEWTASSIEEWIIISPNTGYGNGIIQLCVKGNPSIDPREGIIKISVAGKTESIKIHQEGIQLTVSPDICFDSRGGSISLSVHSNTEWAIEVQDEWIEVSRNSMKGDGSFMVKASDNPSLNSRSGFIIFRSEKTGRQFKFNVKQNARYLSVLADSLEFFAKGGKSDDITIETDGTVFIESLNTWLSVEQLSNELFSVSVARNDDGIEREGKVRIGLSDLNTGSLYKELVVTQSAPYFNVLVDTIHFTYESGQSKSIIVNTDVLTEISDDLDWISVTKESETQYIITSQLYEGTVDRYGSVNVALKDLNSLFSKEIVVVQDAPHLDISTDSLHFYYKGGTSGLAINANGDYIISTTVNWLTITQKINNTIDVIASINDDDTIRSGIVNIKLKYTDVCSKAIKVVQEFDDPDNRYGCVDLGLSVLWADRNLGADSPEQDGTSFAYDSYYDSPSDVDLHEMGPNWRIPTKEEVKELIDKCNWSKSSNNGINGYRIQGNGNNMFIPFNSYRTQAYNYLSVDESGYSYSARFVNQYLYVRGVRPYDYKDGVVIDGISINESIVELNLGETYTFNPVFKSGNKTIVNAPFNSVSDNDTICIVDATGVLSALAPGQCNIMFTSGNTGVTFCPIRVLIPNIELDQDTVVLAIGENSVIHVKANKVGTMTDAPNEWFEWTSDNERIATVNSSGIVTGLSHGICSITVKCGNTQATCKIYVQEPEPVREMVDMGLSVMWGSCNIGATSYDDIGGLYAWGETNPKESADGWATYKWCNYTSGKPFFTKYCTDSSDGFRDNKTILEKVDDVAYVKYGDGWRIPTIEEFKELFDNCNVDVLTDLDMLKFSSKITGNIIYLPYEYKNGDGYTHYWTSSLKETDDLRANTIETYVYFNYSHFSYSNRYMLCAVRPVYEPKEPVLTTDLEINHDSLTLYIGDTLTLRTTVKQGNYSVPVSASWSSKDISVVSVSEEGFVEALSVGTSYIIASYRDLRDTCVITVPVTGVTLNKSNESLTIGNTLKLSATAYSGESVVNSPVLWSSSDASIATVSSEGLVRAINIGSCKIIGSLGDVSDTCFITVPVTGISLNKSNESLTIGNTLNLTATVYSGESVANAPVLWSSSNESIVTVSPDGLVVAKRPGDCVITAQSSTFTSSCSIGVDLGDVMISSPSITLDYGTVYPLKVLVKIGDDWIIAPNNWFSWTTNNDQIVSVDSEGAVSTVAYGNGIITASNRNKSISCNVSIPITAVDLGLTTMWASCNVGAVRPDDSGGYYAWGETTTKDEYTWSTYSFYAGSANMGQYSLHAQNRLFTKYNDNFYCSKWLSGDNKKYIEAVDDAATVNWGDSWRMPTEIELNELINGCEWTWTSYNGNYGYQVTSKTNGNSIFIPASGRYDGSNVAYYNSFGGYWSSRIYGGVNNPNDPYEKDRALLLHMVHSSGSIYVDSTFRYVGCPIRPVLSGTGSDNITVEMSRESVSITMLDDTEIALNATIKASGIIVDVDVEWTSNNETVATVNSNGLVTIKSSGSCTITASYGTKSATCVITVNLLHEGTDNNLDYLFGE